MQLRVLNGAVTIDKRHIGNMGFEAVPKRVIKEYFIELKSCRIVELKCSFIFMSKSPPKHMNALFGVTAEIGRIPLFNYQGILAHPSLPPIDFHQTRIRQDLLFKDTF